MHVTFPEAKNGEDATIPVFATCAKPRKPLAPRPAWCSCRRRFAKAAVVEAVEAGIELIVVITEGIPVADSAYFVELALT